MKDQSYTQVGGDNCAIVHRDKEKKTKCIELKARGMGTSAVRASATVCDPIEERHLSQSGVDSTLAFVLTWGGSCQVLK